jgi:hypothetical protein
VAATAGAEAALPPYAQAAIARAPDDPKPLLLLIAIGAVALLVAMEAGRIALKR